MGMWIQVFCRSAAPLTCGAVMDHIREEHTFDVEPTFQVTVLGPDGATTDLENDAIDRDATSWGFDVIYGAEHRPVQLTFGPPDDATFATIAETLEEHMPDEPPPHVTALAERLKDTRQELVIHFSSAITEAGWDMLDSLEQFVAGRLDGSSSRTRASTRPTSSCSGTSRATTESRAGSQPRA